ncbi:MAG: hypothetical protein JKY61_06025 [Planctomycetes bacterium]|nr:hypothetical protein [Planctomycetota bacterium]
MRPRLSLLWLLALALTFTLPAWCANEGTAAHPTDGPDVELRIQRTQAGLRLALRANLVFLDETLGSRREIQHEIAPEEQEDLELRTIEWLRDSNLLRVDGQPLDFKKLNATWVPADPERIPYFPREGERALTYLDLRLDYPAPANTDRLTVVWPTFPINPVLATPGAPNLDTDPTIEVKAVLMAGPEERVVTLTRLEPSYTWRLPQGQGADHLLPVPAVPAIPKGINPTLWKILALGAAASATLFLWKSKPRLILALVAIGFMFSLGHGSLDTRAEGWNEASAKLVFHSLHGNLYRAFDFHEPEQVYDALEQSVHGDLLEQLYREIHASLIMEEEEGALCRVETVTIEDLTISEQTLQAPLEFTAHCTWKVLGVVHHWGHSHERLLQWKARFKVQATENGWRLVEAKILETRRLELQEATAREQTPEPQGRTF